MIGWWVVLGGSVHGPRVRCDRPEHGNREEPWAMALALHNLYSPDWGVDLESMDFSEDQ
jgi:hypothetical protein